MFASAADARFLVASMPTSVPDLELPTVKVPRSDVLAALLAAVLGQWMVSWAWQQGGYFQLAAVWLCIELAFYAYNCWRYRVLNAPASVEFEVQRVAEIMRRFLGLSKCISIHEFFSGWFHGAPYETIQRGNVKDFVAYGFYCKRTEQLPPALQRATSGFVRGIEAEWGVTFPEGRNESIGFMAHCWEDLRVLPKPLALHLASELGALACHGALRALGFHHRRCQGFTYWIREPSCAPATTAPDSAATTPSASQGPTPSISPLQSPTAAAAQAAELASPFLRSESLLQRSRSVIHRRGDSFSSLRSEEGEPDVAEAAGPRPIFFIHGVGLGLVPYVGLIWQAMRAARHNPMILLEVPTVSLRLNWRAKAVDDVAHAAAQILWRHSYADACFVAHSYGTFCVSRIAQLHSSLVHSMALVDPVCFLTCYPQLLHSFVYKVPKLADMLGSATKALNAARFLFSRDLIIAETFCRKFLWHELMLWPCDMPAHALVVLSHNDDLVPSPLVAAQLAEQHASATVLYHPTAVHGGFLLDLPFQQQIVQGIKQLVELPADVSAAQALPSLRSGLSGLESKLASAGPLRLSRYSNGGAVAFRN